jgi:4-nitrophenyl phosphatase
VSPAARPGARGTAPPVVVCDLDGVVWRGDDAIPGAAAGVARLRGAGIRVGFVTNNSSGTVADDVDRLARAGIAAAPGDVLTSAEAAAALLAGGLPRGARVLACAGPGVWEALAAAGLEPVGAPPAAAVVVGWHREFDFERLTLAADAVRGGARFVATNLDATYPVAGGLQPGAGALVAAVATAGGREPEVAGKPAPAMASLVRARFGSEGVVVGDRPSTDGALASVLGWPFALVRTGVAGAHGGEPVPEPAPDLVADDLLGVAAALVG